MNTTALNGRRDAPRHVHQREEIGLREELAEDFQTLLTTAHTGQPIMHQRYLHTDTAPSHHERATHPAKLAIAVRSTAVRRTWRGNCGAPHLEAQEVDLNEKIGRP